MLRLEAIQQFLEDNANEDMAKLFNEEMEVQVNVGVDGGVRVDRESTTGFKWWGYQNPNNPQEIWKSFRIPYRAKTEESFYEDKTLTYSTEHFEGIGLTGWNWKRKESWWIGFDFDSIANHSQGLSDDELASIRRQIEAIPWTTVRRSTSGKGLHIYVFLNPPIPCKSHTEHAALARAILGIMSVIIGVRLDAKVDVYGAILWVWHRKQSEDGFALLKEGVPLNDVPNNWRDHVEAIRGKRRQKSPVNVTDENKLEELVDKTKTAQLDDEHRRLFGWLSENDCLWWWDSDRTLLVAHTFDLQRAHRALKLKGPFYTIATGKEQGKDQNCFAFPLRKGGWVIRRHTRKCPEHPAWTIDSGGWTRCFYNISADLPTAARCHGGVERSDGKFELASVSEALLVLQDLGAPPLEVEEWIKLRGATLKLHKDGRAIITAIRQPNDPPLPGWSGEKEKCWEKIVTIQVEMSEVEVPDEFIRHLVDGASDAGWYLFTKEWIHEGDSNIRRAMIANGTPIKMVDEVRGHCVLHPWYLVCRPFQPEYPGNRCWNKGAPQFAFEPMSQGGSIEAECPTWVKILEHCGAGLDEAVEQSKWCKENSITDGAAYLFLWAASVFHFPSEPLPYLFFYGPQNSGKSSFHEALGLLFKDRIGYKRADLALTTKFNRELFNSLLCTIEETNLQQQKEAYNKIKDWVTSKTITIHEKQCTPFEVPNLTHWIQCSNEPDACPIFPGDTRIVMVYVGKFTEEELIPKLELLRRLEVEGPAFLDHLLKVTIPYSPDRLRVPCVTSADKMEAEITNASAVTRFINERVYDCSGQAISCEDFYKTFQAWLKPEERRFWDYRRTMKNLPHYLVKGTWKGPHYYIANITFDPAAQPSIPLIKIYYKLVEDA